MKKILAITHDPSKDTGALDFGCHLATLSRTGLTVAYNNEADEPLSPEEAKKEHRPGYFIEARTKEACRKKGVEAEVWSYEPEAADALVYEGRFVDALVLARDNPFGRRQETSPFLREILLKTECPVVVAPTSFLPVEEVVFCYDGSADSLFAMKHFAYLFPSYQDKRILALEIRNFELNPHLRANWLLEHARTRSWLHAHYENVDLQFLQGDPKKELYNFFRNKQNTLIVMGAWGRGAISTLLRKSTSEMLLNATDLPLFIAHH